MDGLTRRQKRVHDLREEGKSPAEIAKRLKISPNAVYGHFRRIDQKLAGRTPAAPGNGSSGNGKAPAATQIDQLVNDAIGTGEERMREIGERNTALEKEIEIRRVEQKQLDEEAQGIKRRLEGLVGVGATQVG